ncbi:outer membrane receptor protein involved in Fe transport [Pedobacter sp. CAN_A7]|uniref:TonB-dependent receptor domain-containing protein n=1 Tax=Pedobacter sp. CAN_A7 TaxID=2787722 RepID=UPI0018CB0D5A
MHRIYILPLLLCLLNIGQLFAQERIGIQGTVIDSASRQPLDYASISLINQADQKAVAGMHTDAKGQFNLSGVATGQYTLRIGFMGYRTFEKTNINYTAGQTINISTVNLRSSGAKILKEVVVSGQTPGMTIGIDRKVFNVEQSLISQGGSVTDLLSDIPSLSVDADGSVSLRGSSGVRILIDGKPSAMAGSDITQVLQSLPANAVQRIEVITNPSSKYEAEGQSGIINIVLKKNLKTGFNGVATTSGGSYRNYNGGISLNYRDSSFNYYGNYDYRKFRRLGDGVNVTRYFENNGIIDNNNEADRSGVGHSAKLGVDYFINQTTTLGLSGNFSIRDNQRNEDLFYSYQNLPKLNGTSTRLSRQTEDDFGWDLNMDFKKEFKRPGEELLFNAAFGRNKEDGINEFNQTFSNVGTPTDRQINDTYERGDNINLQLDYTLPFNENSKFEAGYRSTFEKGDESQLSRRFNVDSNVFVPDYNVSNNFELEESVHALYANYQNRLTERLGFQLGLRAEQAELQTNTISFDPAIPAALRETPGGLDYFRLYPSVFLTQKLGKEGQEQQLQLSYTRRVNRPRGWQVNPFVNISDPLNVRQGNPNLRPEDIHSFELGYSRSLGKTNLTTSVYYRRTNDVIQLISQRIEGSNAATLSEWMNISRNDATGFELISKTNVGKALDFTGNVNVFYNRFFGSQEFNIEERDGINWDANLSTNIRFTKDLSAQIRANYNAPRILAQGETIGNFVMDAALRLQVMGDKGTILFNVRDVFNQRRFGGYTQTGQFIRNFEDRRALRMALLTFSYRFGSNGERQEERERRNDEDDGDN